MKKILLRLLMALGVFILVVVANYFIFSLIATRITEGIPITKNGSGHTALLVVDIQEGTTGDVSALKGLKAQSDELIGNVNQIIKEAQERNWSVIYINTEVVNPLLNLINNTMSRGSGGANLDKRLSVKSDLIVTKRRSDPFNGTALDQILTGLNTDRVVVTGLDAAHCVNSTILAALSRGYQVGVVSDGIISNEEAEKTRMLGEFRALGVEIIEGE